jgi:hypothetical protein
MDKPKKGRVEIPITNVNPKVKQELKNIARYEGITVSQLLRPELRQLANKYPEHVRDGSFLNKG